MQDNNFSIDSLSVQDKDKVFKAVREIDESLVRISAERDHIKAIIDDIHNKTFTPKKLVRKMARTFYKHSFDDDRAENDTFETLYELVCK